MDKLNIFLRFPETDDEVFEFVNDPNLCKELSESLHVVKRYLKNNNHKYCFLYDSINVNEFKDKVSILDDGVYQSKMIMVIRECLGICSQDINKTAIHNPSMTYAIWDYYSCMANICTENVIKSASEQSAMSRENTIVWFLTKGHKYKRDIIPIVIDAPHKGPTLSITQLCETAKDCIHWIRFIEGKIRFSLKNTSVFERTTKIYQRSKQRIYKKRDDDTYWYYDFFHKNNSEHYEVFDRCGAHIGEADMFGNIDSEKKDPTKTISSLIS